MSYIKALIKNLDQSSLNYDTSDTDNDNEIENQEVSNTKEKNNKTSNEKFEALLAAQKILISKCKPSKKFDKIIKNSLKDPNWKGLRLTVKIEDDEIMVRKNEKNYKFSKTKFFTNKVFKYNLINSFTKEYGDKVWIKIYKKESDFKIFVCRNNKN